MGYGCEENCPSRKHGFDCNLVCNCAWNDEQSYIDYSTGQLVKGGAVDCDPRTGQCMCDALHFGQRCEQKCPVGHYGSRCQFSVRCINGDLRIGPDCVSVMC